MNELKICIYPTKKKKTKKIFLLTFHANLICKEISSCEVSFFEPAVF